MKNYGNTIFILRIKDAILITQGTILFLEPDSRAPLEI